MKKSNSNTLLWIGLIAAIGGVATYFVIHNRKKKQVTPKSTGLLVDSAQKTTLTPKEGIALVKALKNKVKSSTI